MLPILLLTSLPEPGLRCANLWPSCCVKLSICLSLQCIRLMASHVKKMSRISPGDGCNLGEFLIDEVYIKYLNTDLTTSGQF